MANYCLYFLSPYKAGGGVHCCAPSLGLMSGGVCVSRAFGTRLRGGLTEYAWLFVGGMEVLALCFFYFFSMLALCFVYASSMFCLCFVYSRAMDGLWMGYVIYRLFVGRDKPKRRGRR